MDLLIVPLHCALIESGASLVSGLISPFTTAISVEIVDGANVPVNINAAIASSTQTKTMLSTARFGARATK